jgi:site-specific DNA recombinase
VIEIVKDEGFSGKNLDRPGMKKIITMACQKQFDVIVTYKLDRLTRSVKDLGYLIEDVFNKHDIAFTSVTDNFDTSTANGKLILNILGSVAQWERDIISERTKDVLNYKKQNKKVYGHCPFGFLVDENDNLIENPEEQKTINFIKDLRKEGLSLSKIATRLNQDEIPTKKGCKWASETIRKILRNSINQFQQHPVSCC